MSMPDIRAFISSHLLEPLKRYPTLIQDTMIEIITQKLQSLYEYTLQFPEIVSPNMNRLDILKTISEQFLFTIRDDADIQEQIDILDNILYVYSKRGSIDTIENMWKYYGGELPKDVKVIIPSYNLFRYSVSSLSGNHVFQDNGVNRTGVYEIRLTNNTYPIPELREFLLKELVAAGNYIYFQNSLHMDISRDDLFTNPYEYLVAEDTFVNIELLVPRLSPGFTWSGYNPLSKRSEDSTWSGRGSIFLELTNMIDLTQDNLTHILLNTYKTYQELGFAVSTMMSPSDLIYFIHSYENTEYIINEFLYCTPTDSSLSISRYLYNRQGNLIESNYPGYFVLNETLLGEEVI